MSQESEVSPLIGVNFDAPWDLNSFFDHIFDLTTWLPGDE